jgi:hypothetical protein
MKRREKEKRKENSNVMLLMKRNCKKCVGGHFPLFFPVQGWAPLYGGQAQGKVREDEYVDVFCIHV